MTAPPHKPRSVATAVVVALLVAALFVGALLAGDVPIMLFACVFILGAQAELYKAMRVAGHTPAAVPGVVCGGVLLVSCFLYGAQGVAFGVALSVVVCGLWSRNSFVATLLGVLYVPLLGSFAILLLIARRGIWLVFGMIMLTAIFDAGAYLVGRKLGRHYMSPRSSPKKTWEGFVAGLVISLAIASATLPLTQAFSLRDVLILGAVLAITTPLGDLAESIIKRDLGVKDMGSIMPGHGGFMDRIDAIIFNAPVAYGVLHLLGRV